MSTPAENDLPPGRPSARPPASLIPSSVESAIAEDSSPFVRPSVSALRRVKLRKYFWSLPGTAVYSVNAGQMPAEVISRAAKKLRELGAATGFVFNRASARNRCLTITMQRIRLRTEVPPSLSSDALN